MVYIILVKVQVNELWMNWKIGFIWSSDYVVYVNEGAQLTSGSEARSGAFNIIQYVSIVGIKVLLLDLWWESQFLATDTLYASVV